jgi:O-antigen/teichoic acid export membrane protein
MRGYGLERFGVLTLVWALVGYLALFELGLGRTLTVKLAPLADGAEKSGLVRCGLALGAMAGLLGAALTALFAPWLTASVLKVPAAWQTDALNAFWLAALAVMPTTLMGVGRGVLEAQQKFAASNALRTAVGVGGFVFPWLCLQMGLNSVAAAVASLLLLRMLCCAVLLLWIKPQWQAHDQQPLWGRARELLRFGGWLTVSSVVGPVMVYGDRFLIGANLSLADVSRYSMVQELVQRLLVLPTAFTSAWLPQQAQRSGAEQRAAERQGHRKFLLCMLALCGAAALLMQPALNLWLGSQMATSLQPMGWILCLGVLLNAFAQWPFTALHARGDVKATALFHVIQLPLYLAVVFAFTAQWGLSGAAWAWTLRAAVDWIGLEWLMRRNN